MNLVYRKPAMRLRGWRAAIVVWRRKRGVSDTNRPCAAFIESNGGSVGSAGLIGLPDVVWRFDFIW